MSNFYEVWILKIGAVILTGGKSRRMGTDKSKLKINGKTFLDRIADQLSEFPELLVSIDRAKNHPDIAHKMVEDVYSGCGPIGGLHAALSACSSDALFAVSCDVPMFARSLDEGLCRMLTDEIDAVVARGEGGRLHPLCAVYKKHTKDIFDSFIKLGDYRLISALGQMKVAYYELTPEEESSLQNINTAEDYRLLCSSFSKNQQMLVICGVKNSGKTTLIEKLIPAISAQGITIATIKHDGHGFTPDTPGKDSYRFFRAGASASAIFDGEKFSISRRAAVDEAVLAAMMPEAELIILEGFKDSSYPKIEVIRSANLKAPASDIKTCVALVSDLNLEYGIPVFGLNSIGEIADFIADGVKDGRFR